MNMEGFIQGERSYGLIKVKNGWVLSTRFDTWVCDTLGEALDQLAAEEKKFPNDE